MGIINKQAVLEHIAQSTKRDISDVKRAVTTEYEKDSIDFTSSKGVDLFAAYLKSQSIFKIIGNSRLEVKVSLSKFQKPITSNDVATFYIDGIYALQFYHRYKEEFNFCGD